MLPPITVLLPHVFVFILKLLVLHSLLTDHHLCPAKLVPIGLASRLYEIAHYTPIIRIHRAEFRVIKLGWRKR